MDRLVETKPYDQGRDFLGGLMYVGGWKILWCFPPSSFIFFLWVFLIPWFFIVLMYVGGCIVLFLSNLWCWFITFILLGRLEPFATRKTEWRLVRMI